jgi:tellurite resistance protein TerC
MNPLFAGAASATAIPTTPPVGAEFPLWAWGGFLVFVALMLALDLGVFHRKNKDGETHGKVPFKEALAWSVAWISLALVFGTGLFFTKGLVVAETFAAGYLTELALSVDNLFIFLIVFSFFKIPENLQHRVLCWGIIGAALMRGGFIIGGVTLLDKFDWLMVVFGAFLIFTGIKLLLPEKEKDLGKNIFVRLGQKIFPITPELHGRHFFVNDTQTKRWKATPLFLALLVIEGSDVVFAVDSIPAVMGVLPKSMHYDTKLFVAFTSNIFAILGLRSLYFVLAGFMQTFRFLKYGLAAILGFIGAKMLIAELLEWHLSPTTSLGVLGGILVTAVSLSLLFPKKK